MEMQKVPAAGYPIIGLDIVGIQRKNILKNLSFPYKLWKSLREARRIIDEFKPDLAVGFGGFASGPILYAAANAGVPIAVQEQNSYAGITNKRLGEKASEVFTAYENMDRFFPKEKIRLTGNPVRSDILKPGIGREQALAQFGLKPEAKTILVLGGSLGARTINDSIGAGIKTLAASGFQVLWQTGKLYIEEARRKAEGLEDQGIRVFDFITDMAAAYAAADVIVARAGALTISELCIVGKPAVLVPSPNVAEDHQTKNAEVLAKQGAALLVKDAAAEESLIPTVLTLLRDEARFASLSTNIKKLAMPDAAKRITDRLLSLLGIQNAEEKVDPRPEQFSKLYFIGIGGIGMSALAAWFRARGCTVAGYDRTPSPVTEWLQKKGVEIHFEDSLEAVPEAFKSSGAERNTLIVYTPAVPKEHRELTYFREQGFTVMKRSEVLGLVTQSAFTVAVAGTHGKTTTSSMIAHILTYAGKNCTAFLGGIAANYDSNLLLGARDADDEIMVVEADEYDRSFLRLHPDMAVVTSADPDHLDIYGEKEALRKSFQDFIGKIKSSGKLILKEGLDLSVYSNIRLFEYSIKTGDYYASDVRIEEGEFVFTLHTPQGSYADFRLSMPGYHNTENAVAAAAVALLLDVTPDVVREALAVYKGVKRRFEYIIKRDDVVYIDDYAHHPEEIKAFIRSVKALYPNKKLTVVFQPHLYSRTRDFADEFAVSLSKADEIILMDIYPARELPMEGVSSEMILEKIASDNKRLLGTEALKAFLRNEPVEVLATVGAGDIDRLAEPIKEILLEKRHVSEI